jgi:hypothetical protein
MESTANGADGWFHHWWRECKAGKTGYVPLFQAWFSVPEHRITTRREFQPTAEEREWMQAFHLDAAQINWYRATMNEMVAKEPWGGDRKMHQEFPFTDVEAFQASGFCVVPDSVLARLRETVRPPDHCVEPIPIGTGQFRAESCDWKDNALAIWEKPNPNLWYACGVDISDGVGATESVVSVWAYPGYTQVAEWGSKHSSLEHTAWVANWIASLYGKDGARVLMVPEINKSGPLIIYILNQIQTPSWDMYRWQYLDKHVPYSSDNPKLGWETNDVTKTMLPQAFNKIFMSGIGAVRSAQLYEQMGRCIDVLPSRRWRVAGKGSDRVLAALIGIMGAYVDFEGGEVQGVTGGRPAEPGDPDDGTRRERGTYDAEYDEVFSGLSKARTSGNYQAQDYA